MSSNLVKKTNYQNYPIFDTLFFLIIIIISIHIYDFPGRWTGWTYLTVSWIEFDRISNEEYCIFFSIYVSPDLVIMYKYLLFDRPIFFCRRLYNYELPLQNDQENTLFRNGKSIYYLLEHLFHSSLTFIGSLNYELSTVCSLLLGHVVIKANFAAKTAKAGGEIWPFLGAFPWTVDTCWFRG